MVGRLLGEFENVRTHIQIRTKITNSFRGDPERPQVYGIAARKGHREPWKTGLAMDQGSLEHPGIKDWGDIPDYDKIAKEKAVAAAKEKTEKYKEMKKKERNKAGKAEAKKKEEEKYVKLPWYMAAMGVKAVKLPPKPE